MPSRRRSRENLEESRESFLESEKRRRRLNFRADDHQDDKDETDPQKMPAAPFDLGKVDCPPEIEKQTKEIEDLIMGLTHSELPSETAEEMVAVLLGADESSKLAAVQWVLEQNDQLLLHSVDCLQLLHLDKDDAEKQLRTLFKTAKLVSVSKFVFNKKLQCDYCGAMFATKHVIAQHIFSVHLKFRLFDCNECQAKLSHKLSLNQHMKIFHGKLSFTCDVCSKSFPLKQYLRLHVRTKHLIRKRIFKCQLCGSDFLTKTGLQCHHSVIHERTKLQCDTCGKAFGLKLALLIHITTVHQKQRPFKCNVCGATFTRYFHLQTHKAAKHDQIRLQCDACGAEFGRKGHMTTHIRSVHLKLRVFRIPNLNGLG